MNITVKGPVPKVFMSACMHECVYAPLLYTDKTRKDVGLGTFGRVVECEDKKGRLCAIKIVRRIKKYTESAKIESDILRDVNKKGGRGTSHIVKLYERFEHEGT